VGVTHYLSRFIRWIFLEIERGTLSFPNFYREWAEPTYKIARFFVIVFAAIVVFPYLPGAGSPAFQGVGVFLGLLFSLGSASAIGNLVAGLVLTYMRAFQVGDRVKIGDETRLYPRVVIYHSCQLGRRVIVHSGAVIGADGFGLANEQGRWLKIPQIGRVLIGDDVEVGANTTIDRGALDDTVIEEGVKLDNQIQIAHNVRVGAHTAMAGCVGVAGSTRIGRNCTVAGSAMIIGHLEIADRVNISVGTLVTKSISEPGTYTSSIPCLPHRDWLKNAAQLHHLNELAARVKQLEQKLSEGKQS